MALVFANPTLGPLRSATGNFRLDRYALNPQTIGSDSTAARRLYHRRARLQRRRTGDAVLLSAPPASAVAVSKDQACGTLQMDVYRPANAAGRTLPVLVFFNIASGAQLSNFFYKPWAEIAASRSRRHPAGPARRQLLREGFRCALIAHVTANASSLGIDRDRIALYAGSGNVYGALPGAKPQADTSRPL